MVPIPGIIALTVPAETNGADVAVGGMGVAVGAPPVFALEPQAANTRASASSATHFIRCLFIDLFLSDCLQAVHSSGVGLRTPHSRSLLGNALSYQDVLGLFLDLFGLGGERLSNSLTPAILTPRSNALPYRKTCLPGKGGVSL